MAEQASEVYVYQRKPINFTLNDPYNSVTSTKQTGTYPYGTQVTLTANTGTTLTAKADSANGTNVTSGMYVLKDTPVYPKGELQTGYKLHGRVIRPAKVKIAKP